MTISESLRKDLMKAKKALRCEEKYGGHVLGKPFIRVGIWRRKCKRCRQDFVMGSFEAQQYFKNWSEFKSKEFKSNRRNRRGW